MRFRQRMRVRFGHSDPARIAYYPRFFEWFHDAFEAMFEQVLGIHYAQVLETHQVGYPAVQSACEWKRPARFGDDVMLEVFLSRLGARSATFEYRVKRDGELLATASVKIAAMHMVEQTSAAIPEPVRQALLPYVEDVPEEQPDLSRLR
jgi:4-hydroxybenzoyl-CoA thioesterase